MTEDGRARLDPRLALAVAAGRATAAVIRRLGRGGGTTLPGRISARIDPQALHKLSTGLAAGSILVSGTNGKTTTAGLLREMLSTAGYDVISNSAGSNLGWGLTSALVQDGTQRRERRIGVFEVDEGSLPSVAASVGPRMIVVTNLFRDQLDRYGELEASATAVGAALAALPQSANAVLCADDPGVSALGEGLRAAVTRFGVEDLSAGTPGLPHAADAKFCPRCGEPFDFQRVFVGHMGHFSCPTGDTVRRTPDLAAATVRLAGIQGQALDLSGLSMETTPVEVPIAGLHNTYNILAAVAAARLLGVEPGLIATALRSAEPAFGRLQRMTVEGRALHLMLAKNPTGFNEVLALAGGNGAGGHYLVAVNDRLADGRDISWLWDVDFERLRGAERVVLAGERALDMAIRLKYAGLPNDRVHVLEAIPAALDDALGATPAGGDLFVLPTYTAMLDIHAELARRGLTRRFWEPA